MGEWHDKAVERVLKLLPELEVSSVQRKDAERVVAAVLTPDEHTVLTPVSTVLLDREDGKWSPALEARLEKGAEDGFVDLMFRTVDDLRLSRAAAEVVDARAHPDRLAHAIDQLAQVVTAS